MGDDGELGPCGRPRDARFEATLDGEPAGRIAAKEVDTAEEGRLHGVGYPDAGAAQSSRESRGCDPHYGERAAVQDYQRPQNLRIGGEAVAPDFFIKHHDRRGARSGAFFVAEEAAEGKLIEPIDGKEIA